MMAGCKETLKITYDPIWPGCAVVQICAENSLA